MDLSNKVKDMSIDNKTGDQIRAQVEHKLLSTYSEGSVGCLSADYNKLYKDKVRKLTGQNIDGHTINWSIENGKVIFGDGQSIMPVDRSNFFNYLDTTKQLEYVNIDEDLANSIFYRYAYRRR